MGNGEKMSTEFDPNATLECDAVWTLLQEEWDLEPDEREPCAEYETLYRFHDRRADSFEELAEKLEQRFRREKEQRENTEEKLRIAVEFLNNRREFFTACGASMADATLKEIERVGE